MVRAMMKRPGAHPSKHSLLQMQQFKLCQLSKAFPHVNNLIVGCPQHAQGVENLNIRGDCCYLVVADVQLLHSCHRPPLLVLREKGMEVNTPIPNVRKHEHYLAKL